MRTHTMEPAHFKDWLVDDQLVPTTATLTRNLPRRSSWMEVSEPTPFGPGVVARLENGEAVLVREVRGRKVRIRRAVGSLRSQPLSTGALVIAVGRL